MSNPLLVENQLPLFDQITPEHALPALEQVLSESRQAIVALLCQVDFTWDNLMRPMEVISDRLDKVWSPVRHLNSVNNTPEWREAYNACLPKLTEYFTELGQNVALYEAVLKIKNTDQFLSLNETQKKIIDDELRDFNLSGVALVGEPRERYAVLQKELNKLTTKFEENVLDATQAFTYYTQDQGELDGIPEHALALAQQNAQQNEQEGWLLTLDMPCYLAVMKYADQRELRETFYQAFVTRASEVESSKSTLDNSEVMLGILAIREEESTLLGFNNYAEYSLATKMAETPEEVVSFLEDLSARSVKRAQEEFEELQEFASSHYKVDQLAPWDIAYYSEKLQQQKYAVDDEVLRPYFPENKVFSGMFEVVNRIYGLIIREVEDFQSWNNTVRLFEICDEAGGVRGLFYADLYARKQKRGGAWMDDCQGRYLLTSGAIQAPVAFLTCNFNKPIGDQPALLTHDDVITLFHEFGHGLHHMLTQVNYLSAAGINGVEWDAVELPSQFMENFCWQEQVIPLISEHYQTKEPIPRNLFENMLKAKNFQSAMHMVRQLEFALFDFKLHMSKAPKAAQEVQALLNSVRDKVSVAPIADYNRFQHSFSHIFAGGYGAGYYSYKWAEVLSSDAFSLFEETDVLSREVGQHFLHAILERGSSKPAMEMFVEFRGRKPSVEALLVHNGIDV